MTQSKAPGHRWFAALYDRLTARAESTFMKEIRREIAGGVEGKVLEIGCGTGASFPYYGQGVEQLVATEPDPYMMARAREKAQALGLAVDLQPAAAETLPFPDGAFDAVVSALVLCSVRDPARALAEVRRVLKPGGQFRFYEHVRYGHPIGALCQDLVTPLWRWFGAGCHPNRDIEGLIRSSGFNIVQLQHLAPFPPIPPLVFSRPHIKGVALA